MATTNNLNGVMSLTPEQYNTLVTDGEITVGGVTYEYDEGTMYLVKPEEAFLGNGLTLNDETGEISANVQDVQIKGTSILVDGIANIPTAGTSLSQRGVIYAYTSFGTNVNGNGALSVEKATDAEIAAKTNAYKPIVPSNLQVAVDVGVKGSEYYQSFSCEMSDGSQKILKIFCELL